MDRTIIKKENKERSVCRMFTKTEFLLYPYQSYGSYNEVTKTILR